MNTDCDDDVKLSESTLKALQEFYAEQAKLQQNESDISEDWKLSQFWYDQHTTTTLTNEVLKLIQDFKSEQKPFSIACISCPTLFKGLYNALNLNSENNNNDSNVFIKLFEYDKRFETMYTNKYFEFYDYNEPLNVNESYKSNKFDLIIADPPYISDECWIKTSMTIRHLLTNDTKLILCTGEILFDLIKKCFSNIHICKFEPKHERGLANQFKCYANYSTHYLDNSN